MVWRFELQRAAGFLATALFATVLLSGCVAESPRTELDWYPQGDAVHHHPRVAANTPPAHAPASHVHRHPGSITHRDLPPPVRQARLDRATPRTGPAGRHWYNDNTDTPPAVPEPVTYAPAAGALAFVWPVSGPVISDFGTTLSGGRNDGINIAIPFGTPIHAAAAGQISYAGNELRGYGNLVLIKHDDGYVTAYAHAERIVVNRGDMVTKGQIIGYAGQTGDVTSPQLHFEIRKGVAPVNPRSLLAASRA
jgi:murein DD-endopeptidase MepM/ murein hydrolase activator NlpD